MTTPSASLPEAVNKAAASITPNKTVNVVVAPNESLSPSTTHPNSPSASSVVGDNESDIMAHIIDDLKNDPESFYGAIPDLASHAEFFIGSSMGDIAVVKGTGVNAQWYFRN